MCATEMGGGEGEVPGERCRRRRKSPSAWLLELTDGRESGMMGKRRKEKDKGLVRPEPRMKGR